MFPIKDAIRTWTTPHVNRMLIIANVVIFLMMFFSDLGLIDSRFADDITDRFAMSPYYVIQGQRLYTLLTSMFLHAGVFHLFGNMLYLYIFGDNVEDTFGHVSYLTFYIICGLAASLTYTMSLRSFSPDNVVVGASGAISGVLGAYLILYPEARILSVIFYGLPIIVPVPAILFLGFWFLMQWLYVLFGIGGNVAWWAHIGGFVAGMVLAALFGRERKKSREARFGP